MLLSSIKIKKSLTDLSERLVKVRDSLHFEAITERDWNIAYKILLFLEPFKIGNSLII